MSSSSIYVVYLTIYRGTLMPALYIGSSSKKKVESGYRGSVSSREYAAVWKKCLREEPENFSTHILSMHHTRKDALDSERILQRCVSAVEDPRFINKAYAGVHPRNSGMGRPMSDKTRMALKLANAGRKHSQETRQKMKASRAKRPPVNDETRERLRASSAKRPPVGDETRKKMSDAAKRRWSNSL